MILEDKAKKIQVKLAQQVGVWVNEYISVSGIAPHDLSLALGITDATMKKLISGKLNCSLALLAKLGATTGQQPYLQYSPHVWDKVWLAEKKYGVK